MSVEKSVVILKDTIESLLSECNEMFFNLDTAEVKSNLKDLSPKDLKHFVALFSQVVVITENIVDELEV